MSNEKIYQMDTAKIYGLLLNKVLKKGRTKEELDEAVRWLTGYSQKELEELLQGPLPYAEFFQNAPKLEERYGLVTGVVCGVRVETIEEPLMRAIRCLDKLADELAKGKPMEKILRKESQ
ncbi:MAG: DUF2200 domain-containing protein [Eubacterium sp.]|nr:DUF2200 domain-containing protein [Eubacterium sp.]